ncbi:MAG: hypothetical protein ACRDEA_01385 [Microcystaceae cyanobacterium]
MRFTLSISPLAIAKRLTFGVVILATISIAIQIAKYVFNYRADWMTMFNLDREMNFPTWYSTLMLAFCAILLRLIANGKKEQRDRYSRYWNILSLIFWFLALDEVASIHELLIIPSVAKDLHLPWFLHSIWVIPGAIFVVIFLQKYWKFTMHLPKRSRFHFILAAALYIGGALMMEMVGSEIAELEGQQHLTYALLASLEEVMEMMGVIVFIYGLLFYIGQWAQDLQLQIKIFDVPPKADLHERQSGK